LEGGNHFSPQSAAAEINSIVIVHHNTSYGRGV
jgi:hypothetical protein